MNPLVLKALPYIAAVALLVCAYAVGHTKGNASCEIKNADAKVTAVGKEQIAVTKVGEKYGPELKSLQDAKDVGGSVGPLTTRALDGLR